MPWDGLRQRVTRSVCLTPEYLDGELDGDALAPPLSHALAGDVERGSVVDRCAHKGKTERDVDPVRKTRELDRDMSLVVIHRNLQVEVPALPPPEQRVGRDRAHRVDAQCHRGIDGRNHMLDLF